MRENMYI